MSENQSGVSEYSKSDAAAGLYQHIIIKRTPCGAKKFPDNFCNSENVMSLTTLQIWRVVRKVIWYWMFQNMPQMFVCFKLREC